MQTRTSDQQHLDGNALAGPLRELFAVDVSQALTRCAGCGSTAVIAQLEVYAHAPGGVARCPGCQSVVLRLVRSPSEAWLDLRGTAWLRIPLPGESVGAAGEPGEVGTGEPFRDTPAGA